jgi:hypothetical protein
MKCANPFGFAAAHGENILPRVSAAKRLFRDVKPVAYRAPQRSRLPLSRGQKETEADNPALLSAKSCLDFIQGGNGAARENRTLDLSLTKGVLYH